MKTTYTFIVVQWGTKQSPALQTFSWETFEADHDLQPFLYVRYLDDNVMIWEYGMDELKKFLHHINTQADSI